MATTKLPSYVQVHKLAGGKKAFYWVRPKWASPPAERHGRRCPVESTPLGTDEIAARVKGAALTEAFAQWRKGETAASTPGTIAALFRWYRESERFKGLRHITRRGYRVAMDMVEAIEMKTGTFGTRQAKAIDATAADRLYKKAIAKHGDRQGAYMMQVCRLIWNQAMRPGNSKTTGVKENPFLGMGIKSSSGPGRGNRAATRAEYDAYRAAARAMGKQSMATAATLCFECCQRVYDAFGFEDPDKRVSRGVLWKDYRPGARIGLIQSKTGNVVDLPLVDMIDCESIALYPELEEELARMERREDGGLIVRDERTGEPYTVDYMATLHRRIRKKAELPADLRFTSFRHGGLTEIGDSGTDDVRAVSGHSTLEVTRIYNKANEAKAKAIAGRRREHIARLLGGPDAQELAPE